MPFEFAVFDQHGQEAELALLRREWPKSKTRNPTGVRVPAERHLAGTHAYGGVVIDQWGHFILETLARAWFWRDCAAPLVLHCERPFLKPWHTALLDLLGRRPSTIHLIDCCTSFKRLLVPEPGYVIANRFHQDQAAALGIVAWRPDAGRRIWISRSRLGPNARGTFTNESLIETALAERGWLIAHPQEMDVAAQIDLFAKAEHVAGIEGSALHTVVFVAEFQGILSIIPRKPGGKPNSRNYDLISNTCGFVQRIYPGPIRQLSGDGAFGQLEIDDPDSCVRYMTQG